MAASLERHLADAVALTLFLVCWLGFGPFANWLSRRRPSLIVIVRDFRRRWIERISEREHHIADATVLSNLLRGALFFASTSVLVLGGLAALLGAAPSFGALLSELPFADVAPPWLVEGKIALLILVQVYAFLKFTWSAWLYNVLSIMVGMAPAPTADAAQKTDFIETAAPLAALAGDSYNNGIRAYYFSMALIAWFIHPWLFAVATAVLTAVLYRREFHSQALSVLRRMPQR